MSLPSRKISWRGAAVRLGGTVIILALLFHFLHPGELWATMRRLPLALWLAVLAGYLAAHTIGVSKWRLTVNLAGAGLNFAQAARCYFAGLFSTLLLPSIVGGDVVRAGLALRLGRSKAGVLLGSLVDRVLDFVALAGIAAVGAMLVPGSLDERSRRVFAAVALTFLAVALLFLVIVTAVPARRFTYKMRRWLVRLRQAGRSMAERPRYVIGALGLGVMGQTSLIALTAVVAAGCSLRLPFQEWMIAWPLAKLSALLPVSQGGIGVREAALAALLVPFGARAVVVVAVGLVWETIIIAGGLMAGLTSFLLGRSSSWQTSRVDTAALPAEKPLSPRR